jgi:hypothetical protein
MLKSGSGNHNNNFSTIKGLSVFLIIVYIFIFAPKPGFSTGITFGFSDRKYLMQDFAVDLDVYAYSIKPIYSRSMKKDSFQWAAISLRAEWDEEELSIFNTWGWTANLVTGFSLGLGLGYNLDQRDCLIARLAGTFGFGILYTEFVYRYDPEKDLNSGSSFSAGVGFGVPCPWFPKVVNGWGWNW